LGLGYRWLADQGRGTAWIVPALTLGTVFLLVAMYHGWPVVLVAPLLAGSGVFVGVLARHAAFDPNPSDRRSARLAVVASVYVTAFVLLSVLYAYRMRSLLSAPAVALVAVLVVLVVTDGYDARLRRRIGIGFASGIVLAEVTWALNQWNAPGWYGGVVLTAILVAVASLVSARLEERVDRGLIARFSGFVVVVVAVVAFLADRSM
jgi:hypothetical protein